jgi:hypothetical protein
MHGIKLSHVTLRWARLKCLFLGHEKWGDLDGAWFCMRCLQTHDIELRWVRERFDPNRDRQILMGDFQAMMRRRSDQLAARNKSSVSTPSGDSA